MRALRLLATGTAFAAASAASPAVATVDDLQIAWVITKEALAKRDNHPNPGSLLRTLLLPQRLFVSDEIVADSKGKKLLPAGAQLYLMIGERLTVCSQEHFEKGFAGAGRRICLIDQNGDQKFDTYFTKSMGRSWLTGDEMWFAMNSSIPKKTKPVRPFSYQEIDRTEAKVSPTFWLVLGGPDGEEKFSIGSTFETRHSFGTRCVTMGRMRLTNSTSFDLACPFPETAISVFVKDATGQIERLQADFPKRDVAVRFDVAPRLLGTRLMSGAYFE